MNAASSVICHFIVSALALRYFYVSAEWKRTIELEALARIRALQARIFFELSALARKAPANS